MATYSLPDLPYDYSALAPAISGDILELHHDKAPRCVRQGANDTSNKLRRHATRARTAASLVSKTFAFNLSGHVFALDLLGTTCPRRWRPPRR